MRYDPNHKKKDVKAIDSNGDDRNTDPEDKWLYEDDADIDDYIDEDDDDYDNYDDYDDYADTYEEEEEEDYSKYLEENRN